MEKDNEKKKIINKKIEKIKNEIKILKECDNDYWKLREYMNTKRK